MFATYEDLVQAVEERRKDVLTLEVDLGSKYSQEHEDAKAELKKAQAIGTLAGNQAFLSDNLARLEARVEETKPPSRLAYVQYHRVSLEDWSSLMRQTGLTPLEQYEKVLPKTFIGVFGQDPVEPEDYDATENGPWVKPEPLSTDGALVSSKGNKGILLGASLHLAVQAFMTWQNSGGDVNIRPTRSGLV